MALSDLLPIKFNNEIIRINKLYNKKYSKNLLIYNWEISIFFK